MCDLVPIVVLFLLSFVGFPLSASIERDVERNEVKFFGEIVPLYYDDDTDGLRNRCFSSPIGFRYKCGLPRNEGIFLDFRCP